MLPTDFFPADPNASGLALLALADGTVFHGMSIGAPGQAIGEVVFNTSMTGYQEILTDPSYARQIVTLTYPHIGNTGANDEDVEATRIHAAGLVIRDLPRTYSNFRAQRSLSEYLRAEGCLAIAGIDTRRLTRLLREKGAQNGAILAECAGDANDIEKALALARSFPGLAGLDLAKVVSVREPYDWTDSVWKLGVGYQRDVATRFHVVAFDYGIKHNILRMLAARGCRVTVIPAQASSTDALALEPDGIFPVERSGRPRALRLCDRCDA